MGWAVTRGLICLGLKGPESIVEISGYFGESLLKPWGCLPFCHSEPALETWTWPGQLDVCLNFSAEYKNIPQLLGALWTSVCQSLEVEVRVASMLSLLV